MKLLTRHKAKLTVLFLSLLIGMLTFFLMASKINAACYCENPEDPYDDGGASGQCRCTSSPPSSATYHITHYGGDGRPIEIWCDSQVEANTFWSRINPVCGSAVETIPYCAPEDPNTSTINWTCWGSEWFPSSVDGVDMLDNRLEGADQEWVRGVTGPFRFNGVDFGNGGTWDVWVCRADNYCCDRSDVPIPCVGGSVPVGTDCNPSDSSINPPDWCGVIRGPGYIDCDEIGDELHTFRPYPSYPCDRVAHNLSLFCGNTLNLTDGFSIEKRWTIDESGLITAQYYYTDDPNCSDHENWCAITDDTTYSCTNNDDGTETCTFNIADRAVSFNIYIDGAFFPIMGNTERVTNSRQASDNLTDPQKVNEYVSWYLNGLTNNPAEYGAGLSCIPEGEVCDEAPNSCCVGYCGVNPLSGVNYECTTIEGLPRHPNANLAENTNADQNSKLVNYSGVLKKLLPHRLQRDYAAEESLEGLLSYEEDANIRHNQIVGCVKNLLNNPFDWSKIVACYHEHEVEDIQRKETRIGLWQEENDDGERAYLPPNEEDYEEFEDWLVRYKEWRGLFCINFFGVNYCVNNPFSPDYIANLFFTSPIMSTEDRVGRINVSGAGFLTIPVTTPNTQSHRVTSYTLEDNNPEHHSASGYPYSNLFFAHMQEVSELADILQNTFSARDEEKVTEVTNVEPPRWCDVQEVRSNPGDNLYPEDMYGQITYSSEVECNFMTYDPINAPGNLCENVINGTCGEPPGYDCCNYGSLDCAGGELCVTGCQEIPTSASLECELVYGYECVPNCEECLIRHSTYDDTCGGGFKCGEDCSGHVSSSIPTEACETAIMTMLNTQTETPLANEVWSRLVAGSKGVFKKFFPQIDEGDDNVPIQAIWDIPASSPIMFTSPWLNSVGNPAAGRDVPEIYFSHIGGVHQYFLKCLQTAIRPQGFGETCISGTPGDYYCTCFPPFDYTYCMDQHPDININIRGYSPSTTASLNYIYDFHPIGPLLDPRAPQLNTLLENDPQPGINAVYDINNWDWENNVQGPRIDPPAGVPSDFATLVEFDTHSGQGVFVPDSGYDIGNGYEVMVLYATTNSIVLKYTAEDDMVAGYGIHLEGLTVDNEILYLYNQLNQAGREELPVLCAGKRIGTAPNSGIRVAVRDTGAFMDPRWFNDWWINGTTAVEDNCPILTRDPDRDCSIAPEELQTGTPPSASYEPDPECFAPILVDYLNEVINHAGSLTHVRFLSPVFNMTNPVGPAIAREMTNYDPNWYAPLSGIAGNAYNCCGGVVTGHVDYFMGESGLNYVHPAMITETGIMTGSREGFANQMEIVRNSSQYTGALIFNAFDYNVGAYSSIWNRLGIEGLDMACDGPCGKIGANTTSYYPIRNSYFDSVNGYEMDYVLAILSDNPQDEHIGFIQNVINAGLTPIIRIGDMENPGPPADVYGDFLAELDQQVTGTVYAILGPNEPQTEYWLTMECFENQEQ